LNKTTLDVGPGQSAPRHSKRRKSAKSGSHPNQRATEHNDQAIQPLVFHQVDQDRWADLEQLFEGRGGPHHCWCMVWRATPEEARHTDGKSRKAALKKRIEGHVPVGILGYLGDRPVAWCSIAPRATYRRLGGIEEPGDDPERVWSLVCFFVSRELRGQGVLARLIQASVEHARRRGAQVVEAYPVDPDSPSYRFMGFKPSFEAAGFREVGQAGTRRYVMRLDLN
jgi:GNAT superfamily N-acetyltransferase